MGILNMKEQTGDKERSQKTPTIYRVKHTHYDGTVPEFIARGLESVLLEYPECNVQSLTQDRCDPLGVEIKVDGGVIALFFEKCVCTDAVFFSNE